MAELLFTVVDVVPERYAAAPNLLARIRVEESTGEVVHALALRAQIRIEPQRRRYDDPESPALLDLFGDRTRFADTLRPFAWLHASTVAQGFSDATEIELPLPCTYDFEVSGTTYLHALRDGRDPAAVPLQRHGLHPRRQRLLRRPDALGPRGSVPPAGRRLARPDAASFPGTEWLRMRRDTVEALGHYRHVHGLTSWDDAVTALLADARAPAAAELP